jgi:hypothetical protein
LGIGVVCVNVPLAFWNKMLGLTAALVRNFASVTTALLEIGNARVDVENIRNLLLIAAVALPL